MVFNILEIALVSFYLGLQVSHTSPLLKKLEKQVNSIFHGTITFRPSMKILQSLATNGTNFKIAYFGYYSICQKGTNELASLKRTIFSCFFSTFVAAIRPSPNLISMLRVVCTLYIVIKILNGL